MAVSEGSAELPSQWLAKHWQHSDDLPSHVLPQYLHLPQKQAPRSLCVAALNSLRRHLQHAAELKQQWGPNAVQNLKDVRVALLRRPETVRVALLRPVRHFALSFCSRRRSFVS
jgi:hypothetical protein